MLCLVSEMRGVDYCDGREGFDRFLFGPELDCISRQEIPSLRSIDIDTGNTLSVIL